MYEQVAPNKRRYNVEQRYDDQRRNAPYGPATVVFAWALFVAAETLGWPLASEVDAIFDDG